MGSQFTQLVLTALCFATMRDGPLPCCRAVASPSDPAKPLQSAVSPLLQLSGTTGLGPCVLGARVGADTTSGVCTSWSAGINYTRMNTTAAAAGQGSVERLNGQQVGAWGHWCDGGDSASQWVGAAASTGSASRGMLLLGGSQALKNGRVCVLHCVCSSSKRKHRAGRHQVGAVSMPLLFCHPGEQPLNLACGLVILNDALNIFHHPAVPTVCCALQWGVLVNDSCGPAGRSATLSLHQLVSGGKTSLAAEYTLPINKAGECCWNIMRTCKSMQCG